MKSSPTNRILQLQLALCGGRRGKRKDEGCTYAVLLAQFGDLQNLFVNLRPARSSVEYSFITVMCPGAVIHGDEV
jgi:hypothetical protein